MKNKMGSKFIRVRVEHPQRKKEDIELVQDVIAYHIFNIFKFEESGLRGFSQYDLEIDVKVKPMLEHTKEHTSRSVVSSPHFPKPIALDGLRGKGRAYKKWVSGEVVQFCLRWKVKN